jgi:hypothetical protein
MSYHWHFYCVLASQDVHMFQGHMIQEMKAGIAKSWDV